MVWALLVGPLIGVVAVVWVRLVQRSGALRPRRWGRFAAPLIVFVILGVVSIQYPAAAGQRQGRRPGGGAGRHVTGPAVRAAGAQAAGHRWPVWAPGSPGGLFTPDAHRRGVAGRGAGEVWNHIWPGARLGSYAVIGGGAFLAAAMQGPLSGVVLVLELTRNFDSLMAPTLLAVIEATVIARRLGAPSIYSARLRPDPDALPARSAGAAAIDTPGAGWLATLRGGRGGRGARPSRSALNDERRPVRGRSHGGRRSEAQVRLRVAALPARAAGQTAEPLLLQLTRLAERNAQLDARSAAGSAARRRPGQTAA